MAHRKNQPHRVKARQEAAAKRQAKYDALSTEEKLARAKRRGGSTKEINRLEEALK